MLKKILNKVNLPTWLIVFLGLILILRIPSFFEPYYYGDEMIYLSLGNAIRQGIPLYRGIFDNKPPFLYIIAAIAGNLFWFKAILAFWNLTTICLFWKLSRVLFPKKEKLGRIATIIFGLLTTLPLLEGNIINAELFMVGFTISGLLLIFSKKQNFRNLFLAGILFSLASLFKVPALFDLPAVIIFWFIIAIAEKQNISEVFKKTLFILTGFLTPILFCLIWFWFKGSLKDFFQEAFLQNIGYLSTFRPQDVQKPFLLKNLPLIIRTGIVALATFILFLKRKTLSWQFIFINLWLIFGLFAVTLSERPYPHYLIQVVPSVSLLLAILFCQSSFEQSLSIFGLTLTFFVPVFYKYYHYPTFSYYLRFARFATGISSNKDYLLSFDKNTVRNYNIANFVNASSGKKDNIYVIGDSTVIYSLSRRLPPGKFIADYHITDYSSFEKEAEIVNQKKPKFIILLPQKLNISSFIPVIRKSYILVSEIDGAEIWKLSFNK